LLTKWTTIYSLECERVSIKKNNWLTGKVRGDLQLLQKKRFDANQFSESAEYFKEITKLYV
jgi:hypothetical protein